MSRTLDRDDRERLEDKPAKATFGNASRSQELHSRTEHIRTPLPHDRQPRATPDRWSAAARLTLPRSRDRRPVILGRQLYMLRGTESDLLATVGAFRVVAERDLAAPDRNLPQDVRSLRDQGLLESCTVVINHTAEHVLALTRTGRALLDHHRSPSGSPESPGERPQVFYEGVVKLRELAHDAQLYRLFTSEREAIEAEGGTVTRVSLDYELKRDYYQYAEDRIRNGAARDAARREFAEQHDLPFGQGRIKLPDLRIEYETPEGDRGWRDVELATEHYSRSQVAGKQAAGFSVYRAAGARAFGAPSRGGSPFDPHHLERLR